MQRASLPILHFSAILVFDPVTFEFVRDVPTLVDGRWHLERRAHAFSDVLAAQMLPVQTNWVEGVSALLNMVSYWTELSWHFGADRSLLFALLFANALSPHRHLSDADLLPVAVRLHARSLQFLKQYVCEWRAPALLQLQLERLQSTLCSSSAAPDFNAQMLARLPQALREFAASLIAPSSIRAHLDTSAGEVRAHTSN